MTTQHYEFRVNRRDLTSTAFADLGEPQDVVLEDGQVLLDVERFALTANNITYAVFGDAMRYWDFFPTSEGWGIVPVWGFANVAASRHPDIAVGERVFGYLPVATHVVMTPGSVKAHGFTDAAEHRAELHPVYNQYRRCGGDPTYRADREDEEMLYRPLFMTSFLIDDFIADNDFFGAKAVVISSASSKTALGAAFRTFNARRGEVEVIGLTSAGNVDFVERLGCYDRVLAYEDLSTLPADTPVVYLDIAGNNRLRHDVHHHFGDALRYSCAIGGAHWDQFGQDDDLPGAKPTLFFAPAQIKKREQDWGPGGVQKRFAAAWEAFIPFVSKLVEVEHHAGPSALEAAYRALLAGDVAPSRGIIVATH